MSYAVRRSLCLVTGVVLIAGITGCGSSESEAKPNPDMKVPDVPPGGHGSKDKAIANPKKK
ncbi:MAG: hypothetical protein U0798_13965 [Gemmataceae bacterium]